MTTSMTIQPLHLATTTLAMAAGLFTSASLFNGLDGEDIQPRPDPVVHVDVEVERVDERPEPRRRAARFFELGVSRRADVLDWAATTNLTCERKAMGRHVSCDGELGEVEARFDGRGQLVSMEIRRWMADGEAEELYSSTAVNLEEAVGPPTSTVRDDRFVRHAYERTERHFDYRGYEATIIATHFGKRGLQVLERYRTTR